MSASPSQGQEPPHAHSRKWSCPCWLGSNNVNGLLVPIPTARAVRESREREKGRERVEALSGCGPAEGRCLSLGLYHGSLLLPSSLGG